MQSSGQKEVQYQERSIMRKPFELLVILLLLSLSIFRMISLQFWFMPLFSFSQISYLNTSTAALWFSAFLQNMPRYTCKIYCRDGILIFLDFSLSATHFSILTAYGQLPESLTKDTAWLILFTTLPTVSRQFPSGRLSIIVPGCCSHSRTSRLELNSSEKTGHFLPREMASNLRDWIALRLLRLSLASSNWPLRMRQSLQYFQAVLKSLSLLAQQPILNSIFQSLMLTNLASFKQQSKALSKLFCYMCSPASAIKRRIDSEPCFASSSQFRRSVKQETAAGMPSLIFMI